MKENRSKVCFVKISWNRIIGMELIFTKKTFVDKMKTFSHLFGRCHGWWHVQLIGDQKVNLEMSLGARGGKKKSSWVFFHPSSFFDDDRRHFRVLRLFGNTLATLLDLSVKKIFSFWLPFVHFFNFESCKTTGIFEKKSKANWDCCLFIIFFGEAKWQNWGTYCTKTIYIKMQILVVNHYFYEFYVKTSCFSNQVLFTLTPSQNSQTFMQIHVCLTNLVLISIMQ